MALVGAVEFAGVSICVAAPASAGCDYHLYAQYCDGPLLPDGTFQRCQVAYGQTYPHVPTVSRCYPVDPRQPWPMLPLGQPQRHLCP
jgi:hypothetical protein